MVPFMPQICHLFLHSLSYLHVQRALTYVSLEPPLILPIRDLVSHMKSFCLHIATSVSLVTKDPYEWVPCEWGLPLFDPPLPLSLSSVFQAEGMS